MAAKHRLKGLFGSPCPLWTPIFVTGYERSGTGIMRRIVDMHPDLPCDIVQEPSPGDLCSCSTRKEAMHHKRITVRIAVGFKSPYTNIVKRRKLVKHYTDLFCEPAIVHILRDPILSINSQMRTFGKNFKNCVSNYANSVQRARRIFGKYKRYKEVYYSDLITDPSAFIHNLYRWMGKDVDEEIVQKIIHTRGRWRCGKRLMCGLHNRDIIGPQHAPIDLTKGQRKIINQMKRDQGIDW
jgi:hypothetical protein